MKLITAPERIEETNELTVFLAGSIEGDTAKQWQQIIIDALSDKEVTLVNPRREIWDNSWEQKITNPQFKEQVVWELDALEQADLIVMYFDESTKSPISLLELGLFARSGKLVVCCPNGFWRKGNVDVVCEKFKVQQAENINSLVEFIEIKLS